jgi:glycosyltransferase involved in cell wall biosynthesis
MIRLVVDTKMRQKPIVKVLFMQSQPAVYADSMIHATLMRYFDPGQVEAHAACTLGIGGEKSASMKVLETIPNLHLRPTFFGPSVRVQPRLNNFPEFITGGARLPFSLAGLAGYIKSQEIHLLHCTEKPRDAFYGFLLARITGVKCLIHLHVKVENWISPLTRWAMKHADALVGVSSFVAQSSIAMGFPAQRTCFVLNGMDLAGWKEDIDGSGIRNEFGIDPGIPLFAAVARLVYYKGQSELIQALGKVKERVPDFRLLVVGEGDLSVDGYAANLKRLACELGIENQVIFTGYRKDVRQILAACDVFTLPSFEEPFGMVFLEAMAMKKPVAALDNGGSREIVEHGKSGLLSLPQDIDQLAENLLTLIQNPALRVQMGEYGRIRVEEYFNAGRMARDFEQLYHGII